MAATKKSAAKKSTTKRAGARKSTKAATTKRATTTERAAWIGVSKPEMRMGQRLSVSWRVAGEPHEIVKLWQEGPDGDFHYSVPPKGSIGLQALTAGKYAYSIHDTAGKELCRVEVVVKT
jgi:hypothetical protein